jgi:hypothetical protein
MEVSYGEGVATHTTGAAYFYLVQYREGLSASGWGTESSLYPAVPTSCDIGCPGDPTSASVASIDGLWI